MRKLTLFLACSVLATAAVANTRDARKYYLIASGYAKNIAPDIILATIQNQNDASPFATKLTDAATAQIGVTVHYDPAYVGLSFPGGDIDRARGVCSDVIIRALRDAHNIDLQALVNRDMKRAFGAYPKIWGLSRTDKNIDHRRVPNLEAYFTRRGMKLPNSNAAQDFQPGDIVTWRLPGNLPHIGIVSRISTPSGTPFILHNIGAGAQQDNILFAYDMIGHFRPVAAKF